MSVIDKDIVSSVDPIDMVMGAITKPIVEKVVSPIVGNGNLLSGAAKFGLAFLSAKYAGRGRFGKAMAIGASLDGSEDLVVALGSKVGITAATETSAGVF